MPTQAWGLIRSLTAFRISEIAQRALRRGKAGELLHEARKVALAGAAEEHGAVVERDRHRLVVPLELPVPNVRVVGIVLVLARWERGVRRSEEHTSELQSQ